MIADLLLSSTLGRFDVVSLCTSSTSMLGGQLKGRDLAQLGEEFPDSEVMVFQENMLEEISVGAETNTYGLAGGPVIVLFARERDSTERLYPHYFSTYCIDHEHEACRLTCKNCGKPCLCVCHRLAAPATVQG